MNIFVKIISLGLLTIIGLFSGIIGIQLLITTFQSLGTTADITAILTLPLGLLFILLCFGASFTIYNLIFKKKKKLTR